MSNAQGGLFSAIRNLFSAKPAPSTEAAEPAGALPPVAESFLKCLHASQRVTDPYKLWLLTDVLPKGMCEEIATLPFRAQTKEEADFNGKRNTNDNLRVYFTKENQEKFNAIKQVVDGFQHPLVRRTIEEITGADLTDGHLRVEYCQDTPGFWLEPHTDIFVKKFTMLVYLVDDPELALTGTDVLQGPPDHEYVMSAPYGLNKGVIFIPGPDTWHGVGHHPIPEGKVRKSIIINYVTSDWRDKWELA